MSLHVKQVLLKSTPLSLSQVTHQVLSSQPPASILSGLSKVSFLALFKCQEWGILEQPGIWNFCMRFPSFRLVKRRKGEKEGGRKKRGSRGERSIPWCWLSYDARTSRQCQYIKYCYPPHTHTSHHIPMTQKISHFNLTPSWNIFLISCSSHKPPSISISFCHLYILGILYLWSKR